MPATEDAGDRSQKKDLAHTSNDTKSHREELLLSSIEPSDMTMQIPPSTILTNTSAIIHECEVAEVNLNSSHTFILVRVFDVVAVVQSVRCDCMDCVIYSLL